VKAFFPVHGVASLDEWLLASTGFSDIAPLKIRPSARLETSETPRRTEKTEQFVQKVNLTNLETTVSDINEL
jgi:hypothetical protein